MLLKSFQGYFILVAINVCFSNSSPLYVEPNSSPQQELQHGELTNTGRPKRKSAVAAESRSKGEEIYNIV